MPKIGSAIIAIHALIFIINKLNIFNDITFGVISIDCIISLICGCKEFARFGEQIINSDT